MVLYWSLWFLIGGSQSQGETLTVHPLLCDNLAQRDKNSLFSWTSMNRKNRRRQDLAETSVPWFYSYTKTCVILREKYTIIMTSDFWVIRELALAAAQWLVHRFVVLVEAPFENKTSTIVLQQHFQRCFLFVTQALLVRSFDNVKRWCDIKMFFSPIGDLPAYVRCK